jgi:hypothetical protein
LGRRLTNLARARFCQTATESVNTIFARHRSRGKRSDEQAAYFGLTRAGAIKLREEAKAFTAATLQRRFTIQTRWRKVFGPTRYYAVVFTVDRNVMKMKQSILRYVAASLMAAAIISLTAPASARDQVPFRGIVSGSVISITPLDECNQRIEAVNGGNATHLDASVGPHNLSSTCVT